MMARNVPEPHGEPAAGPVVGPVLEPVLEPDELELFGPDDEDFGDGGGPSRTRRLADDEFLAGTAHRTPGVTHALTSAGERIRVAARRHPVVSGIAAVCVAALALAAAVVATRPKPSAFAARVPTARYKLGGTDRVVSTLTLSNPTSGTVTLDNVAIGGPGGQDIGLGETAVHVTIPSGQSREVVVRGRLDCRADQPALPAQVQLTGTDFWGQSRTLSVAMPGSAEFSASVDTYRRGICRVPYPLGVTSIRYGGTLPRGNDPGYAVAMRLNVSVATVPGMDPTAVRYATVTSDMPGVRVMLREPGDVVVAPGTPGTIDVEWVVDDCSRVPAYAGIPALSVMGVDQRGTQMWDYALGDRFNADLSAGIRAACQGSGSGVSS